MYKACINPQLTYVDKKLHGLGDRENSHFKPILPNKKDIMQWLGRLRVATARLSLQLRTRKASFAGFSFYPFARGG